MKRISAWTLLVAVVVSLFSCASRREKLPPTDEPANTPMPSKREYVGLSRRDAALKAWGAGQSFRVIEVDGRPISEDAPSDPNRLNFVIRNDTVVKVTKG